MEFRDDVQLCDPCWDKLTDEYGREVVRGYAKKLAKDLRNGFDAMLLEFQKTEKA